MHNTTQNLSKVPWLGDMPILGALFRSNKFQHDETELVVIVTPYLVKPAATALATPTRWFRARRTTPSRCCGATPGDKACRVRRAGRSAPAARG